jgi:hypothetical protein
MLPPKHGPAKSGSGGSVAWGEDDKPLDPSHSIRQVEVDRRCVWVLAWEGSLDALRALPRAMRVEHLEAKCRGCRGGE